MMTLESGLNTVQVYVNVDDTGAVTDGIYGKYIIPEKEYQFFFIMEESEVDYLENMMVTIDGFTPKLVLKANTLV